MKPKIALGGRGRGNNSANPMHGAMRRGALVVWPAEVGGEQRRVVPLDHCETCGKVTFVRYGDRPLCLRDANKLS